jgi:hypothetical protein
MAVHADGVNFFIPPPASINKFDNGTVGNYWAEYRSSDANGDGIYDSPYTLYGNNRDNYPLAEPASISTSPIEPPIDMTLDTEPSQQNSDAQGRPDLPIEYALLAAFGALLVACAALLVYRRKHRRAAA